MTADPSQRPGQPLATEARPRSVPEELIVRGIGEIPGAVVLVFDRELRYVLVRGRALADNVLDPEQYEGRRAVDVVPPRRWQHLEGLYRAALEGRTAVGEVGPAPRRPVDVPREGRWRWPHGQCGLSS